MTRSNAMDGLTEPDGLAQHWGLEDDNAHPFHTAPAAWQLSLHGQQLHAAAFVAGASPASGPWQQPIAQDPYSRAPMWHAPGGQPPDAPYAERRWTQSDAGSTPDKMLVRKKQKYATP